jgi:Zn-dependent protease
MIDKTQDGYVPERWVPGREASGSWSVHLSYLRGIDVRLHIHFPLLALLAVYGSFRYFPHHGPLATSSIFGSSTAGSPWAGLQLVLLGLLILLVSVALHELGRLVVVYRLGGHFDRIILTPTGGGTIPRLPDDPTVHLVTALFGPLVHLALMVAAACGLVLAGQPQVIELLKPLAPSLQTGHLQPNGSWLLLAAQLAVWLNWLLLLVNLLPVDPLDGAMLVRGLLWPVVGRASESVMTGRFAMVVALFMAVLAVAYRHATVDTLLGTPIPAWLPLGILAVVLVWGANRCVDGDSIQTRRALDEVDHDAPLWLTPQWPDEEFGHGEDREAVLIERFQDRQQVTLERKRFEQEANEDARVDAILARLHQCTLEELSEEERAVLKRASRRYRQRREKA